MDKTLRQLETELAIVTVGRSDCSRRPLASSIICDLTLVGRNRTNSCRRRLILTYDNYRYTLVFSHLGLPIPPCLYSSTVRLADKRS